MLRYERPDTTCRYCSDCEGARGYFQAILLGCQNNNDIIQFNIPLLFVWLMASIDYHTGFLLGQKKWVINKQTNLLFVSFCSDDIAVLATKGNCVCWIVLLISKSFHLFITSFTTLCRQEKWLLWDKFGLKGFYFMG